MSSGLLLDIERGVCGKCGARREDVPVSVSKSPSIGYQEMAYTASAVMADWLADLNRHERCAPLPAPERAWRQWCGTILGTECSGCVPVIRADWLLEHPHIRACQQLPRQAFVAHTQCELIVFVSHRWESAEHPDVSGRQALYLSLFLASRFAPDQLRKIGVWYDFAVLPQEPRSALEQESLDALLPRLPAIQRLSRTLICSDFVGTATYAQRAWCFLEFFGSIPHEAEFVSGISYRHAHSHAVAEHEAAALTYSLAYLLLSKLAHEEERWRCDRCGLEELKDAELNASHECASVAEAIQSIWERLAQVWKVTKATGVYTTLPAHLRVLLRQRPRSWLEMIVNFNWAWHLGACWDPNVERPTRGVGFDHVKLVKQQLGLCHEKCQTLLLEVSERADSSPRVLRAAARRLRLGCTRASDLDVVMNLTAQESRRLLHELSDPRLVDDNGCTAAHLAAEWQTFAILKALTSHNPVLFDSRDQRGRTLLHSAVFGVSAAHPNLDIVHWLVEERPELVRAVNRFGEPPLAEALTSSTLACVRFLAGRAPDLILLSFRGDSALHRAALNPDAEHICGYVMDVAPALLDMKNAVGQNVLHIAAQTGNASLVELLLRVRPSQASAVDDFGDTPLHAAAEPQGSGQRVEAETPAIIRLLAAAAPESVTRKGSFGQTALEFAEREETLPPAALEALREVSTPMRSASRN